MESERHGAEEAQIELLTVLCVKLFISVFANDICVCLRIATALSQLTKSLFKVTKGNDW